MDNYSFTPFPNLSTKRLVLRQIVTEDVNDLLTLFSDEKMMQFLDRPKAKTVKDARDLIVKINEGISNNESINWAVTQKSDLKLIGLIGFKIFKEHHRAKIGYMLLPDFHGMGIMQEAMSRVLEYGFNSLKLHSKEATVNPYNSASIRFLEKNNFVREAYFRENFCFEGEFLDTVVYSLLNRNVNL